MRLGVPTEVKSGERRVGLTPASVTELTVRGHEITVQAGAGVGIGASDTAYQQAGAMLVDGADEVFATADIIVKVKEPQPDERRMLRQDQILFAYLHLAPDPGQTADLVSSGATCIAYESVTSDGNQLPLLTPMSQVAGRLAVQAGARCLEVASGGVGVLLGGVPGVPPASVVVIGGGVVGSNAIQMAIGLGARVTVLDRDLRVLEELSRRYPYMLRTVFSTPSNVAQEVLDADLVIGAVLLPGARAPRIVSEELVRGMRAGSAIVDVAIDQGGCIATSRPTTHEEPTYIVDDVVHYCVANMPGSVPRTASHALNNATLPYVVALADGGLSALARDERLRAGLNVHAGMITEPSVATALDYEYVPPLDALQSTRPASVLG